MIINMGNDRNRSHGKIEALPTPLKKKVEEKLLTGETYEDIASYLQEQGEDIHFSSVGRYGRKFLNKFESVRIAKEYARLLAEDNAERPATELHEANNLLASQLIMQALVDDDMDAGKEQGAVHIALELLKDKVYGELGEAYPEIAATLLLLAEQTEAEMEKLQ